MDVFAEGGNFLFGKIGHLLVIIAFVAALISSFAYLLGSTKKDSLAWVALGRMTFLLHSVAVFGVAILLLFLIKNHLYEYKYVWRHSSDALPMKYLLASFWEGQEGSTLLWMFWHAILGIILIFTAKKWESPVMVTMALAQALLGSMLLGIIFFGHKFGSSPFQLLRDGMEWPILKLNPSFIPEDGSGLNPLLQNYWMTIHPPTLFLGYALCTVPFAYAMGSLIIGAYKSWVKPVFPWVLAAVMVLGVGILMGGAWAYEALSFGGFWAWDPVENASLVPWIIMVAGLHTLLAYKHSGYSLTGTYILLSFSFLLVLYSSYLTKSGVLGDSSVHSFTDEGMSAQLRLMIYIFSGLFAGLLIFRYAKLPRKSGEEKLSSREFWLFIGSILFVFITIYITVATSVPVINKVFYTNYAIGSDINLIYNDKLIVAGIVLGFLIGIGQFFNYKKTTKDKWLKPLLIPTLISIGLSVLIIVAYEFKRLDYILFAIASVFAFVANVYYTFYKFKGKLLSYGGSLSHAGFALMMVGILISQGKQEVVSHNRLAVDYGESFSEQDKAENILLYENEPSTMNGYEITYLGDSIGRTTTFYKVQYNPIERKGKPFVLTPNVQIDKNMGNVANPSTKRTLFSDLYTHITSAPLASDGEELDSTFTKTYKVKVGDTVELSRSAMVIENINPRADAKGHKLKEGDLAIGVELQYHTVDSVYLLEPVYLIQDRIARSLPERVEEKKVTFAFTKVFPETSEVELTITQAFSRFIIMKAIRFPMINLLWLGALVMTFGIGLSITKRRKEIAR